MSIADRLKICRESLGMTQRDMAITLDIDTTTWQRWEKGSKSPDSKTYEYLVKKGFDANWLLTGNGEMRRGEGIGESREAPGLDAQLISEQIQVQPDPDNHLENDCRLIKKIVIAYESWYAQEGVLNNRMRSMETDAMGKDIANIFRYCKQNPKDWTIEAITEYISEWC